MLAERVQIDRGVTPPVAGCLFELYGKIRVLLFLLIGQLLEIRQILNELDFVGKPCVCDCLIVEIHRPLIPHWLELQTIAQTQLFGDDLKDATIKALGDFKTVFRTSEGKLLVGREEHKPLADEEIGQETIVRQKRG